VGVPLSQLRGGRKPLDPEIHPPTVLMDSSRPYSVDEQPCAVARFGWVIDPRDSHLNWLPTAADLTSWLLPVGEVQSF
jgi:hypothetical protein